MNSRRLVNFDVRRLNGMTVTNKGYLVAAIVCVIIVVMLFPIPSTVVPQWQLQVIDVNGTADDPRIYAATAYHADGHARSDYHAWWVERE